MYRKYYSYNDMPRPISPPSVPVKVSDCAPAVPQQKSERSGILSKLSNDDLILVAVLLILLMDGCEDKLLLAAIGLVFLGDI